MRAMRLPGLLLAGWLPLAAVAAESPGPRELETLVGRWVDLRAQADSEQRGWASQSAQWRQEMGLLETEQARLNQQLAALEQTGESQQELRANLMERREALASALLQVDAHLTRLQPAIAALLPLVPEPLLTEDLKTALLPAVAAAPPGGGAPGAARRIQQLLGALQELERLHNGVHTVKALVALPGEPRRQMDVVYIGLARGFAVTADGGTAAAGTPAADGWHWRPVPALASDIRLLIRIASKEVPPAFVSFPIGGETGVQPGAAQGEVQ